MKILTSLIALSLIASPAIARDRHHNRDHHSRHYDRHHHKHKYRRFGTEEFIGGAILGGILGAVIAGDNNRDREGRHYCVEELMYDRFGNPHYVKQCR